jgi:hypothetical protein
MSTTSKGSLIPRTRTAKDPAGAEDRLIEAENSIQKMTILRMMNHQNPASFFQLPGFALEINAQRFWKLA